MAESPIDFGSSDPEDKPGFPWLIILVIVVVLGIAGGWIYNTRSHQTSAIEVVQAQLTAQKAVLDVERDKVFNYTTQLDDLKQRIASGQVPDRLKAVDEYNKLAALQRDQREKVKTLADEYNANVAKLRELQ